MDRDVERPEDEDREDGADEGLDEYDKADADSFPASDPPVQP